MNNIKKKQKEWRVISMDKKIRLGGKGIGKFLKFCVFIIKIIDGKSILCQYNNNCFGRRVCITTYN